MLKSKKLKIIFGISVITILAGCGSNSFFPEFIKRNLTYVEFDKKNLVEQIGKNIIIPEYNNFYNATSDLDLKIKEFVNNPDTNTLTNAQNAWKAAMSSWQKTELYQFGPVKDLNLAGKIYFWPVNPDSVQEVLSKDKTILKDNYLSSAGATKKGLPVIEYLLFDNVNGNQNIIDAVKTGEQSETRKLYLQLLGTDLKNNANQINQAWNIKQGNYLAKFTAQSDAFNMILNNMISTIEDIKDKKIGEPAGITSGSEPEPDETESVQSNNSKNNIIDNLQSLKSVFNGTEKEDSNDIGLDDYLEYVEQDELKDEINEQIDKCIQSIKNISTPLSLAVTKEPKKVETAYNEIKELLELIKVDLANAINETVHFNSSDGD